MKKTSPIANRVNESLAALASSLLVLGVATPAAAGLEVFQQRELQISTVLWSVEPAVQNGTPNKAALLLGWTAVANDAYSYFDAVNTGVGQLSRITLIAASVETSNKSKNATVTFELCEGGSWDDQNTCLGMAIPLGNYQGANSLSTVIITNLAPGGRLALRATTQRNQAEDFPTTISFSADRSSVRDPWITSS